jgi:hypothetical protein
MEPVHAPSALGVIRNKARLFEHSKVTRHGRAADRQVIGQLLNRAAPSLQQLENGATVAIAECVERVSV